MYERIKTINGRKYRYLVKSVRNGKVVRQKVIKYLGAVEPVYKMVEQQTRKSNAWLFAKRPNKDELQELKNALFSSSSFVRDRARIILFSIDGFQCKEIVEKIGCEIRKVRKAIKKFNSIGLNALEKGKAPGAIPKFTKVQKAQMMKVCATKPELLGMHFTTWSLSKLQRYFIEEKIVDTISMETIRNLMRFEGMRIRKSKRRQYSNDPEFDKKNF